MRPLVIWGHVWRVVRVIPDSPFLIDRTGNHRLATTDPDTKTIRLSTDIPPHMFDQVLIHEAAHAMMDESGMTHAFSNIDDKRDRILLEELLAWFLETHAIEVIDAVSNSLGRMVCVNGTCLREENVMVEILKHPIDDDWAMCKLAALNTAGKTRLVNMPDDEWKHKILRARHSPIRMLEFVIRVNPVPSWVSTHFARHKHAEPFIQSQRNDRQHEYDRNSAPQDAPVSMMLLINAEELMTMANKRLCMCAAEETRSVMQEICDAVIEVNPEFEPFLVPFCVEYGCHEFEPCGRR